MRGLSLGRPVWVVSRITQLPVTCFFAAISERSESPPLLFAGGAPSPSRLIGPSPRLMLTLRTLLTGRRSGTGLNTRAGQERKAASMRCARRDAASLAERVFCGRLFL